MTHCRMVLLLAAVGRFVYAGDDRAISGMSLEDLMQVKVQTVSLHAQSASAAPGDVTVITQDQIHSYGYRTLADVLDHVRGLYITDDHTYQSVGIFGYSVPGDFATRILIMVNGHAMTENIFGSANYFGEDFALDMSLVDRIEVVHGPSSALYGSNGILATVNIFTRKPDSVHGPFVRVDSDSLGKRKVTLAEGFTIGKTSVLASASVFNIAGQHDMYISAYDTPATNNGHAIDMDGSRGYRYFLDIVHGRWELTALGNSREKIQPISWGDTLFNDRGSRARDSRSFVDLSYTRERENGATFNWRVYYDRYQYHGIYHYSESPDAITVNREFDAGDWIGSRLTYRFPLLKGDFTAGAETKFDVRALQSAADVQPIYYQTLNVNKLDRAVAGFVQQEWQVTRRLSVNLGARYDWSYYRNSAVSPRGGLVFRRDQKHSFKFMWGRGFRNPNANELFFDDGDQNIGNPNLKPEHSDTFQITWERRMSESWRLLLSGYRMVDRDIIVPGYTPAGLIQFHNASQFHGTGISAEVSGTLAGRIEVLASFQKQKATFQGDSFAANSPGDVGKIRAGLPVFTNRAFLSTSLLYLSERRTLAGAVIPRYIIPELALTSRRLLPGLEFQVGIRNLTNTYRLDPIGLTSTVDVLPQAGRTFFVTLGSNFGH